MLAHNFAILKLFAFEPIGSVVAMPTLPVSKGHDVPARHDVHHEGDTRIPELERDHLQVIPRCPTRATVWPCMSTWTRTGNIESAVYLNHNSPRIYCAEPRGRRSRRGLLDTSP